MSVSQTLPYKENYCIQLAAPITSFEIVETIKTITTIYPSMHLELILEEILCNIAQHANLEKSAPIYLEYCVDMEQEITIIISDNGFYFDPLNHICPPIPKKISQEYFSGAGVRLLLGYTDKLDYKRKNDQNVLSFKYKAIKGEEVEIKHTVEGGVVLATLSGRVDLISAEKISDYFDILINQGFYLFAIDFKNVIYLSSSGIRIFILLMQKIAPDGGCFFLNMDPEIIDILKVAGFLHLFPLFSSTEDILKHIKQKISK